MKIFIGIILCLFVQFILAISILFYKGEKSYVAYYNIISSFPNAITQGYLKNAIYDKSVDDSLELLKRQSRFIYSNTNEKMIKDLLINTYKIFNILESDEDYKKFSLWLMELRELLDDGYGDYLLNFIEFKTNYRVNQDKKIKEKLFAQIKRDHPANPNIYRDLLVETFLNEEIYKFKDLCKNYYDSYQLTLPIDSKYRVNDSDNFQNKFYLKTEDNKKVFSDEIKINEKTNYTFVKKIINKNNLRIYVRLMEGTTLKLSKVTFLKNNNIIKKFEIDDLNLFSKYGYFLQEKSFVSMGNHLTDEILIFPNEKSFPDSNKIILELRFSKLNISTINCHD